MADNCLDQIRGYYLAVAQVLRGEATAASVFPNTTDIGTSRELAYKEFLKQHAPSKCNVFLGGYLFDEDGIASKQLDVIVTTDTAPRFDLHNKDGSGKAFSPVEGCLAVISVKSMLNKEALEDALYGFASIPPTRPLEGRVNPLITISNYADWPFKVIYATDGIAGETLFEHLNCFYKANPNIPIERRPNHIHVLGKHLFIRGTVTSFVRDVKSGTDRKIALGEYWGTAYKSDLHGIAWTLSQLQENAAASSHINFSYVQMMNKIVGIV
jgi:hypothetical protein